MAQLSAPEPAPRRSSAAIALAPPAPTFKRAPPPPPPSFSPSELQFVPPTPSSTPASFEPSHYLNPGAQWMQGQSWGTSARGTPGGEFGLATPANTPADPSYFLQNQSNFASAMAKFADDDVAPAPPPPGDVEDDFAPAPPASEEELERVQFDPFSPLFDDGRTDEALDDEAMLSGKIDIASKLSEQASHEPSLADLKMNGSHQSHADAHSFHVSTTMARIGRDVYIIEAVRTPIARGRPDGALAGIHPIDLLATTLHEVVTRANVPKVHVEDVIGGIVTPVKDQGANLPRFAALKAGFPVTTAGVQLNRMCGSSQQAIHFGSQAIASGDMECVIACGVEMMGLVPMGSDGDLTAVQAVMPNTKVIHQGVSAELIAEKWNITRPELDKLAGLSHERADAAMQAGKFKQQIAPVKVTKKDGSVVTVTEDEGIRVPVDYARMAKLPTPFKPNGKISAANASQISDGAAAILLMSESKMKELGLKPKARIVTRVVVGSDPVMMLDGVIPATKQALAKAGLRADQIDVFEINEAFGSVVLSWMKEIKPDPNRVNPNGGAQALGHPLGATGAILMTKLVHELERRGGRYGLQTMCIGYGQATCTIIENLSPPKAKL